MRWEALAAALTISALFVHAAPAVAAPEQHPTVTTHVIQPAVIWSKEYRAAKSNDADDMQGYEKSLYRGIWYDPKAEKARVCIMKRESNFRYKAANKTSSARGAYQFLDRSWRQGLVWMFIAESKKTHDGLLKEAKKLRKKPIHTWSRYWQDRAFYTAWRFGKGRHHWFHGSIRCF